jgi:DNA-directed RNA polymerase specialized sigma24 family protein
VTVKVDGYDELFRESYTRLVFLGLSMSGDPELARDLAQETMLRAHRHWAEISEYDEPGAWLRRVMTNLLIDHHRSKVSEGAAVERLARQYQSPAPLSPTPVGRGTNYFDGLPSAVRSVGSSWSRSAKKRS